MPRRRATSIFESPVLTGAVVVLVLVIGVYISYGADRGLPFVPTYQFNVDVRDAAKLVPGDSVHVGGARVGQVIKERAMPGNPPYAQLTLALTQSQRVPVDTTFEVRPLSILGAKYVALKLGHSKQNVRAGGTLPVSQSGEPVEIDQALQVFNKTTTGSIRSGINGLGDAFAGRGADINATFTAVSQLLPPLEHVLRLTISPRTDLVGFIDGLDRVTTALAPVAAQFAGIFQNGATTFEALAAANNAYASAIEQSPATETLGTNVLRDILPVVHQAAVLLRDIRPGTALLPTASRRFAVALEAGIRPLRRSVVLAPLVNNLDAAINNVIPPRSQALANSLNELEATTGPLGQTLQLFVPAQTVCNNIGILFRNSASAVSVGDANGATLSAGILINAPQDVLTPQPSANLHFDTYPVENATSCNSGNEPYDPSTAAIGPPKGRTPTTVDQTSPPPDATALAQRAGLLTPPPGARP